MNRSSGFTIIEVLTALAVFATIVTLLGGMMPALGMTGRSTGGLQVNQATQAYLETVQQQWQTDDNRFGVLTTAPTALSDYTWTLTVCALDAAYACTNTATYTQPTVPAYTAPAGSDLVRLVLRYLPAGSRAQGPLVTTLEVHK